MPVDFVAGAACETVSATVGSAKTMVANKVTKARTMSFLFMGLNIEFDAVGQKNSPAVTGDAVREFLRITFSSCLSWPASSLPS